jgi:hypothetical protein
MALVIESVILFNYVKDSQAQRAADLKAIATLEQNFKQLSNSAVMHNDTKPQTEVENAAVQQFGEDLARYMRENNSRLNSLTTAVGTVSGSVNYLQQQVSTFKPGQQDTTTGALTGFVLEENRGKLPPLSSVSLFYNPKETDPNRAFTGTSWQHYTESFTSAFGQWEQDKTHGYKTSVKLSRTVSKPDPSDPTKLVVVGKEDIPITSGDTVYTPEGLTTPSPFKVPRWTASFGVSKDGNSSHGYQPAALLDYRVTNKVGAFAGVVNKAGVVGFSIRLGGQK